jgi:ABC-type Fe3+-hydroxamate transport system substrate-binding protein
MAKTERSKALEVLANYDEKIAKVEKELKKLTDKRQAFYLRTISDEMKTKNMTLEDFFRQMDKTEKPAEQPITQKQIQQTLRYSIHSEYRLFYGGKYG